MTDVRIFVVDDDTISLRAIGRSLARFGTVTLLDPATDIVTEYLRTFPTDIAVLDFTGHPVDEWIEAVAPALAIVYTAHDPTPVIPHAFAVVRKSDPASLLEAIARAVSALEERR